MNKELKKVLVMLPLLMVALLAKAQGENISMAVAMSADCQLDSNTKSILKNKVLKIATSEGVAATECGAIVIIPEVDILNNQSVDGGMRKISTIELGLTLTVRNILTNTVFNTAQVTLRGEGYSDTEAMRSAINKIDVSSSRFSNFITTSKSKIVKYYADNTSALISKAKSLATRQLYDEALAILTTYPESLSGYPAVSSAIKDIFSKCQTQYCSQILVAAESAYSRRDYEEASMLISLIDATSPCATKAKSLLVSIKKAMDKQYADALALEKEAIRSHERIQTAQINAAKEVAKAYFERQNNYVFFW